MLECSLYDGPGGSAGSSGSSDLPPLLATSAPTASPPADDDDAIPSEAIFGLVAAGIAVELVICIGLYLYYRRWKARCKTAAQALQSAKDANARKKAAV